MKKVLFLMGTGMFLLFSANLAADIPKLINYQGMLTDDTGEPLDGDFDLYFRIYNAPASGTMRWEEAHSAVEVTDGLFNVILGIHSGGGVDLDFSENYWLEVQVEKDTMPTRLQFTSVGYAYRAKLADTATVAVSAPTGGGWTDEGNVVRLDWSFDSVGIGIADPAEKLHVGGDVRIPAGRDIAFADDHTRIHEWSDDLFVTADDDLVLEPDDDIFIRADGGSDWIRIDPGAREVGIGTTEPTEMLHVENSASGATAFLKIETSHPSNWGEAGMRIETPDNMWHLRMDDDSHNNLPDTGSLALRSQNSGKEVMVWTDDGHVGIGTKEPSAKLDVVGELELNGDLEVTGAYKGNISSSSGPDGAPFPRPAYDSGWLGISKGEVCTLSHDIGGHPDNYVVDLQFASTNGPGRHQQGYGGYEDNLGYDRGTVWRLLTSSQITVFRWPDDLSTDSVRVRIWVYK